MTIDHTVNQLLKAYQDDGGVQIEQGVILPDQATIQSIIDHVQHVMFPGFNQPIPADQKDLKVHITHHCQSIYKNLEMAVFRALSFRDHNDKSQGDIQTDATTIVDQFFNDLTLLRAALLKDAQAIYEMDPAAKNEPEIMLAYPGFKAISVYRLAHYFDQKNVPLIPRMMTEAVHSQTGIDIHPRATIGSHFSIDHGTGLVIGETAIIGNHVRLYQGVTIGALSVAKSDSEVKRHPTIEDYVTVYARTTILGGHTTIGAHSIIGGNLWIVESIPPHAKVSHQTLPPIMK